MCWSFVLIMSACLYVACHVLYYQSSLLKIYLKDYIVGEVCECNEIIMEEVLALINVSYDGQVCVGK